MKKGNKTSDFSEDKVITNEDSISFFHEKKVIKLDKITKNIIYIRKKVHKTSKKTFKNNKKRIEKCKRMLLEKNSKSYEIYNKINEFNNNGKKTIVYFIDNFYPCVDGVLSVMENYIEYMRGIYNVVVCAPMHKHKPVKFDKYFVLFSDSIYFKKQGYDLAFPKFDIKFQNYLSLLRIDLIHLQSPFNMGNFGLTLSKKRNVPCFITFHSQFKKDFYNATKSDVLSNWLTKIILNVFKNSSLVLTMNSFAENVIRSYGYKKHIEIVPNATNMVKKDFNENYENEILSKHDIDKNKFNMIFIGRFVSVKNIYFILDVIKKLYDDGEDFNFIFLGYGPEENKMKKFCEKNNLNEIVKFTGKIVNEDEKAVIINSSNLLFFPSLYETDGIVRMEAACYNVPTFCLENTSLASAIKDDHNGFVCENNFEKCCDKIKFLIKNVDFVKKIGKNANLEIYFTWEKSCQKLDKLYQKYLKSNYFKNSKNNKNNSTKNI